MSFIVIKDATFVRSDTSPSPTPGSVGDGWIDVDGSVWEIHSNAATAPANSGLGTGNLVRPSGDNFADGKVRIYPVGNATGDRAHFTVARYQDASNFYNAFTFGVGSTPQMTIAVCIGGTQTQLVTDTGMTFPTGDAWYTEFTLIGSALTFNLYDLSDTLIHSTTFTDSTILGTGQWGIESYNGVSFSEVIGYSVPSDFVPGHITKTGDTETSVTLHGSDASGGITPYSYQWYRSQTTGFIPGPSNVLSGATSQTLTDTGLTPGATYFYVLGYFDSTSPTPQVVYSSQFAEVVPAIPPVVIGFIGDSITFGADLVNQPAPPTQQVQFLNKTVAVSDLYSAINNGISGTDTNDWIGGSTDLNTAISDFTAAGVTLVQIMLGTNDSRLDTETSQAQYTTNLQSTIDALVSAGFTKIVLNGSPYVSATMTGWDPMISNGLILQYYQAIDSLAASNPGVVLVGDQLAQPWFQDNQAQLGSDGIHPDDDGTISLGYLWAQAYIKLFIHSGGGTTPTEGDVVYVPDFSDSNTTVI